jgi:hypothetical protein
MPSLPHPLLHSPHSTRQDTILQILGLYDRPLNPTLGQVHIPPVRGILIQCELKMSLKRDSW